MMKKVSGGTLMVVFTMLMIMLSTTNTHNCCLAARTARDDGSSTQRGVTLNVTDKHAVLDNGILQIRIAVPQGYVSGIKYNGIDNLLETYNREPNRGYWDVVWGAPRVRCEAAGCTDWMLGSHWKVIRQTESQVELSFTRKWDRRGWNSTRHLPQLPVNVDRRYVMLRGLSGFYSYAIMERNDGFPRTDIHQIRAVYKLRSDRFHYMAISDEKQRIMPMPEDRQTGQPLDFKEAVLLTNPVNRDLRGEVDDKYQYSCEDKDNRVHGWVSSTPSVGFWMINPSDEFRSAGPVKQDLTSHTGPTTLAMFHSAHYAGSDVTMSFKDKERWRKVYGPYFVYLNSADGDSDPYLLWKDAKRQMSEETRKWPYPFPMSEHFAKADQRGVVSGRLLVNDRYVKNSLIFAGSAWVGLATPGKPGSWQTESKGYQFWSQADNNGNFEIRDIREGNYSLYAFVPGFIGDYKYEIDIPIAPGCDIRLGDLIYEPLRSGPTLWEIGFPDRTAQEFYIPDPSALRLNKLYLHNHHDKFRQYGLWERYRELYPTQDLVYDVDGSDWTRDWFFAHVTKRNKYGNYKPTTWQVKFQLQEINKEENYTLRLAIASATVSEVQVRFNEVGLEVPHFTTKLIGRDNAIARHGIHGLYWLFNVHVKGSWLRNGDNTMYLTQTRSRTQFQGVMYDYLRLEGPAVTM